MNRKGAAKHPPEQKAAEKLLEVLGADNTEDGVAKAKALVGAALADPLVMTVSINRATGRFALASNVQAESAANDLRMLHEAALMLSKQLSDEMVKVAGNAKPNPEPGKTPGT